MMSKILIVDVPNEKPTVYRLFYESIKIYEKKIYQQVSSRN